MVLIHRSARVVQWVCDAHYRLVCSCSPLIQLGTRQKRIVKEEIGVLYSTIGWVVEEVHDFQPHAMTAQVSDGSVVLNDGGELATNQVKVNILLIML